MNKITAMPILLALVIGHAHAQSASSAQQTSTSQSVAQGTIQFSQSPADQHLSETVRNVSAPILGAYAASFSSFNCGQTTQGGFAIAGFSSAFGSSKDQHSCVLEVMAAESVRQSTVTEDVSTKSKLQQAAINARCMISADATKIMEAAGLTCQTRVADREDSQPASTRISSGN